MFVYQVSAHCMVYFHGNFAGNFVGNISNLMCNFKMFSMLSLFSAKSLRVKLLQNFYPGNSVRDDEMKNQTKKKVYPSYSIYIRKKRI